MIPKRLYSLIILAVFVGSIHAEPLATACPLAPRPHLHVGQQAVVAPGVDVLNLRALPARDTGVSGRLYAGTTLTVIGGSSCNGGYTWWRVETSGGARGWVAEGTWEGYWVVPLADADQPVDPVEWSCGVGIGSRRCWLPD